MDKALIQNVQRIIINQLKNTDDPNKTYQQIWAIYKMMQSKWLHLLNVDFSTVIRKRKINDTVKYHWKITIITKMKISSNNATMNIFSSFGAHTNVLIPIRHTLRCGIYGSKSLYIQVQCIQSIIQCLLCLFTLQFVVHKKSTCHKYLAILGIFYIIGS
jgi:hypothetical protein